MKNIKEYILENNGEYNGQNELAEYLANLILSKKDEDTELKIDGSDLNFECIFFEKLILSYKINNDIKGNIIGFSDSVNDGSFEKETDELKKLFKEYNFNDKTQMLYSINIDLEFKENVTKTNLIGRINHELNHLYTYYKILVDDFKEGSMKILVPAEYQNSLIKFKNTVYKNIKTNLYHTSNKSKIISSLLCYSLTRFERNAFLGEIDGYIYDNRINIKTKVDIDNALKKCEAYLLYKEETNKIISTIENEWNDEDKKIFVNTYNNIYNDSKSFNKIIKLFKHKLKITIEKLDKNIDNLYAVYKDISENYNGFLYEDYIINLLHNPLSKYVTYF